MMKYFKARVGSVVSDGTTKVKFFDKVFSTEKLEEIKILKSSKTVEEISFEEAKDISPTVFDEDLNTGSDERDEDDVDDHADKTTTGEDVIEMRDLVAQAKALGVPKKEIKKAKTKAELADLIRDAQDALK